MKKKFISIMTVLSMVFTVFLPFNLTVSAQDFGGGNGTENSPYIISTLEDLEEFAAYVNDGNDCTGLYFELSSDIDMSEKYGKGKGENASDVLWTSIGNSKSKFNGTFNGGSKKISGIYMNNTKESSVGFFGYISSDAVIRNLGVSGKIVSSTSAGGIAGISYGTIENCYNISDLNGVSSIGGIVASNNGIVKNCYNSAVINYKKDGVNGNDVGGIVGINSGTVMNSYNTGMIVAAGRIGGIVGSNSGRVENCYNIGSLYKDAQEAGGIIGSYYDGEITNCYYLDTCVTDGNSYGMAVSEESLSWQVTFFEWDFSEVWEIPELSDRPVLKENPESTKGMQKDPYIISNLSELEKLASDVNKGNRFDGVHFKLAEDIDMSEKYNSQTGISWTPIGNYDNSFNGIFNGNGYTISGLYINSEEKFQGLFGYIGLPGMVKNIFVDGAVTASASVAGIAGGSGGIISGCYNMADITGCGDSTFIGGIVGNNTGAVEFCYNNGTINADNKTGGIVGYSNGKYILGCCNMGTVEGEAGFTNSIGGIVGMNVYNKVSECYNCGDVKNSGGIGGIAGNNQMGTIEDCYNTADITGVKTTTVQYAAGIAASNRDGIIQNCYNTGTITYAYGLAGIVSSSSGTVTNCYYLDSSVENSTSYGTGITSQQLALSETFAGFDFENIWEMSEKENRPVLIRNNEKGNGTAANPYLISTLEELEEVSDGVEIGKYREDVYFKLANDIDMSEEYGVGKEASGLDKIWSPVGNMTYEFSGCFDGNGHKITGVYSDFTGNDRGFFGIISKTGIVKNLGLEVIINGMDNVGGLAGNNKGTVRNCYVKGSVSGTNNVGGIIGKNSGNIKNSYSVCEVTGSGNGSGGITGENNSVICNCYNAGNIDANAEVGGIVGINYGAVKDCYSTGNVSGNSDVGGVVGKAHLPVENCYYNNEYYTEEDTSSGVYGKTTAQFESGEVAWLLQNAQIESEGVKSLVWGQLLAEEENDKNPVLSDDTEKKVYKAAFIVSGEEYTNQYANEGGIFTAADAPVSDIFKFKHWSVSDSDLSENLKYIGTENVNEDITLFAVGQEMYGESEKEKNINTVYGESVSEDLSEYAIYAGEKAEKNAFEYTIESGNDVLCAVIDGDMITISDTVPAGEYSLVIKASEKEGNVSLMSLDTSDFVFTLTVKIEPIAELIPEITIDYENELMIGFEIEAQYVIDDTYVTLSDRNLNIADYIGKTISIVRKARNSNYADSIAQVLQIPSRPLPPVEADFKVVQPSEFDGKGTILGITDKMEYSTDGGESWTEGKNEEISEISGGSTYIIRYKATENAFKSDSYSVSIEIFGGEQEETPNIEIDYINEKLIGFKDDADYTINATTAEVSDGSVVINSEWIGKELSIVKKGNGKTTNDSIVQVLQIPSRPLPPAEADFKVIQPAFVNHNGTVLGITDKMEYSTDGGESWTSGSGEDIKVLGGTEIFIRYKASEISFMGDIVKLVINTSILRGWIIRADEITQAIIYAANYNEDGSLKNVKMTPVTLEAGDNNIDITNIDADKIMIWEVMINRPLAKAYVR